MRTVVFLALSAALCLPAAASAETAADKAFAQQIGRALKDSGQLQNYRIGVQYQDGVVKLSGTVTSIEQRDAAVRLARGLDGVAHVVCKLSFPAETVSDSGPPNSWAASDGARPASAQNDQPNVVHAYGNNTPAGPAPGWRQPMPNRAAAPAIPQQTMSRGNMPLPTRVAGGAAHPSHVRQASAQSAYNAAGPYPGGCAPGAMGGGMAGPAGGAGPQAMPAGFVPHGQGRGPSYENAQMPGYAWPSYASYPNYAALTYPKQYSPTAWPYIGPFYPYPQVPLAWRKVSLEWDDGWWFLDFSAHNSSH